MISLLNVIVSETKRRTHDARNEFENTNDHHKFTKTFVENGGTLRREILKDTASHAKFSMVSNCIIYIVIVRTYYASDGTHQN